MASLNDQLAIERTMAPDDVIKLRATFPTLLEALRIQQTVINQLIVRTGGSGSGSGVENLDALTEQVLANENWLGGAVSRANKYDKKQSDEIESALAEINTRSFKREQSTSDDLSYLNTVLGKIISRQGELFRKIEELEAICLSSLAR